MKPLYDQKRRKFIRSLPCCVCGVTRGVQAAHTGLRGLGQIADDRSLIPLCFAHHDRRKPYSIHKLGPVKFQERFGIDIPAIVRRLNTKPFIWLEGSAYVGDFEGELYVLCPKGSGLKGAIRKISSIRLEVLRESFSKRQEIAS